MATVGQYRKKIKSAKGVGKITKALQMVSASKMKRAQEQATYGLPYTNEMHAISKVFSGRVDEGVHPLLMVPNSSNELIIVIAPEKGLCGSLVSNLSYKLDDIVGTDLAKYQFITLGKKAEYIVNRHGGTIIAQFNLGIGKPSYEIIPPIARIITDKFTNGEIGKVSILYSHFLNTMNQQANQITLLPISIDETESNVEKRKDNDILFEPSANELANLFFERYIEVEIYQLVLESYASEHSARMVAMKNANDNAKNLISYLSLEYNKARQSAITAEIADIATS